MDILMHLEKVAQIRQMDSFTRLYAQFDLEKAAELEQSVRKMGATLNAVRARVPLNVWLHQAGRRPQMVEALFDISISGITTAYLIRKRVKYSFFMSNYSSRFNETKWASPRDKLEITLIDSRHFLDIPAVHDEMTRAYAECFEMVDVVYAEWMAAFNSLDERIRVMYQESLLMGYHKRTEYAAEIREMFVDMEFNQVPASSDFDKWRLFGWTLSSKPDGYGHECGTALEIDYGKKSFRTIGWSSDD